VISQDTLIPARYHFDTSVDGWTPTKSGSPRLDRMQAPAFAVQTASCTLDRGTVKIYIFEYGGTEFLILPLLLSIAHQVQETRAQRCASRSSGVRRLQTSESAELGALLDGDVVIRFTGVQVRPTFTYSWHTFPPRLSKSKKVRL
jgi:hypothetical protein